VTSASRSEALADLPAVAEFLPGFEAILVAADAGELVGERDRLHIVV
jgi:hypothetical protein